MNIKNRFFVLGVDRQRGMALVVGLIFLLIITLLAVAMMRSTTMQERMSANSQQQTVTFQGAEAAIRTVMDEINSQTTPSSILNTAWQNGSSPTSTQLAATQRTPNISGSDGSSNGVSASATIARNGDPTYADNSSLGNRGQGSSLKNFNFIIDANSNQTNTGAASHHIQGIARIGPGK